jgi:uncharacterized protein YqfA (UPF0365 family)
MDIIIITIFLAFTLLCLIYSYVPNELQSLANIAGFSKLSLRFGILRLQKIPVKLLFEEYSKLKQHDINIDFDDFNKIWKTGEENIHQITNILIKAKQKGLNISLSEIETYNLNNTNSENYYKILQNSQHFNLHISSEEILDLLRSDFDSDTYFKIYSASKQLNLNINRSEIFKSDFQSALKYIETVKTAVEMNLEYNFIQQSEFNFKEKTDLLINFIEINKHNIAISNDELIEFTKNKLNLNDFIDAIKLIRTNNLDPISNEQIKNHFQKGGNPKQVLESFLYLNANNINLSPETLFTIDLKQKGNLTDIIKKTVIPFDSEPINISAVILKDGLTIIPKIVLSLKEKIETVNNYFDENIFFMSISEIIRKEFLKFNSYEDLLKNLNSFSENAINKINTDYKNIENSRFILNEIKIIDLKTEENTTSKINKENIRLKTEEFKLKKAETELKLSEEIADAFKKGKISLKDYQKEKYIFGSDTEGELPYTK